jgi:putative hemolysin
MPLSARRIVRKFKPVPRTASNPKFAFRPKFAGARVRKGPVPPGTSFARSGSLEVRLARNPVEVRFAQQLRYQVFYEEMSAVPDAAALITRRDEDEFDAVCDHLLVLDHDVSDARTLRSWRKRPRIVGTYRLLRQDVAAAHHGFYTQDEFDLAPLIKRHGPGTNFLELGRSCVLKPYRTKPTIELLWHGIWGYVRLHELDVMVGCASLEGTDPQALALPLSFLHHFASAPEEWRARAHADRYVDMNLMPRDKINPKLALRMLPPLLKGYLRLGAYFGDGAVVDHQFGTTDVLVVLPVSAINARYFAHFGHRDALPKAG